MKRRRRYNEADAFARAAVGFEGCTRCGASPGGPCVSKRGTPVATPHRVRVEQYRANHPPLDVRFKRKLRVFSTFVGVAT